MKTLRHAVFLALILFPFSLLQAGDLTQEQWIAFMAKGFPAAFCAPDQFYRSCFEVSAEECIETVAFAAEDCLARFAGDLPETFTYEAGRKWGPIIEKCIDEAYVETYSSMKIDSAECNATR